MISLSIPPSRMISSDLVYSITVYCNMLPDVFSHTVAEYMQELFKHKLAIKSLAPHLPGSPETPSEVTGYLSEACVQVTDKLVDAFLNISPYKLLNI